MVHRNVRLIKMKILLIVALLLATASVSSASDWRSIGVEEIVLKSKRLKVSARVELDAGKLASIEVTIDGKTVSVPKEELEGMEDVDLRSLRLITPVGNGGPIPPNAPKGHLVVSLNYGPTKYHVKKAREQIVPVMSCARFNFESGSYSERETCLPTQNYKNTWRFFLKSVGAKQIPNGEEKSVENPYEGMGS